MLLLWWAQLFPVFASAAGAGARSSSAPMWPLQRLPGMDRFAASRFLLLQARRSAIASRARDNHVEVLAVERFWTWFGGGGTDSVAAVSEYVEEFDPNASCGACRLR